MSGAFATQKSSLRVAARSINRKLHSGVNRDRPSVKANTSNLRMTG
jgi:hypothetical protein